MKATAARIGKSKNESISVHMDDGVEWVKIKKTVIAGWNFVALVRYDGNSKHGAFLKSATLGGIKKAVAAFPVPVISFDIAEVERSTY